MCQWRLPSDSCLFAQLRGADRHGDLWLQADSLPLQPAKGGQGAVDGSQEHPKGQRAGTGERVEWLLRRQAVKWKQQQAKPPDEMKTRQEMKTDFACFSCTLTALLPLRPWLWCP